MPLIRYIACSGGAIFFAVVAIVGNALLCHVIVRLRSMKTSINYIILNLAVLDAITGLLVIPYVLVRDSQGTFGKPMLSQAHNQSSALADIICKLKTTMWISYNVSPLLLMIMAYERFKAIVHPFSRLDDTATKSRLKWILPLAWIFGVVYIIKEMVVEHYDSKTSLCSFLFYDSKNFVHVAFLTTQIIIPSIVSLVLYGRIICALRKQNIALGPAQPQAARARLKANKKVMWIVLVITIVFYFCCGIPNAFNSLDILFGNVIANMDLRLDFAMVFVSLNSAFNPLICFLFMQSFRDGFGRVFLTRQRFTTSINELQMNGRSR